MKKLQTNFGSPLIRITLVLILAYFPVSSFMLAVKNDLFYSYFPAKFFLSESLKAGEFPLWNPFINYGYPTYGDMSVSFWNPSTWLFALMGYNPYSFTIELLMYMLMAGIGMYLLSGIWTRQTDHRVAFSLMYMCSGFMTAHLQHFNWINAAGLLPFCTYFYWQYLNGGGRKYALGTVFFFAYWCTAVHPGFIIGSIYFFAALTLFHWTGRHNKKPKPGSVVALLALLLLALAGPAIGYAEVIPFTNRSGPVPSDQVLGVTDPSSWISFLLPLASTADTSFLSNDASLRNCYIGLIPIVTILAYLRRRDLRLVNFLLLTAAFFLAVGTSALGKVYAHLPLINHVRLPGEFRLFSIFALILSSVILSGRTDEKDRSRLLKYLSWFYLAATAVAAVHIFLGGESVLRYNGQDHHAALADQLKTLVHALSFSDKVIIQAPVLAAISALLARSSNGLAKPGFVFLVSVEFILVSLLNIPYTGVGKTRLAGISDILSASPKGIQKPYTQPESAVVRNYPYTDPFISNWAFYSKQAATGGLMPYPLVLNLSAEYFNNGGHDSLYQRPFVFLQGEGKAAVVKNSFRSYNIRVDALRADTILIKQVSFGGWKATLDGHPVPLVNSGWPLAGIAIPAGHHTVDISFENNRILFLLIWHLLFMLAMLVALLRYLIRYILP